MKADAFIAVTDAGRKPRRSKLDPYATDLRQLQSAGYTLVQLRDFLAANSVTASLGAIHGFLRKQP